MPRYGFSIVPVDPFKKPERHLLDSVEKQCKIDFSPLSTRIEIFDKPHVIVAGENEACMTCPKCGAIDKEYKWFDGLPRHYSTDEITEEPLNFNCVMPCCDQAASIFDFDFQYPTKPLELGAGFASAEVCIDEAKTRGLNSDDLIVYSKLMGCPVRAILMMS